MKKPTTKTVAKHTVFTTGKRTFIRRAITLTKRLGIEVVQVDAETQQKMDSIASTWKRVKKSKPKINSGDPRTTGRRPAKATDRT